MFRRSSLRRVLLGTFCTLAMTATAVTATTVTSFSPQGEVTALRPTIVATFSTPMVEASQVGQTLPGLASPLRIRPTIEGAAVWSDTKRLEFKPAKPLPPASEFFADFGPGGIKDVTGALLAGPQSFSFNTPGLKVLGIEQVGIEPDGSMKILIRFSAAMEPQRLYGFMSLWRQPSEEMLPYRIVSKKPDKDLLILTNSLGDETRSLKCQIVSGLRPDGGTLGLARTQVVQLPVVRVVEVNDTSVNSGKVTFRLTDNVDLKTVKQYVTISPAANFRVSGSYNGFAIESDAFKPRSRYTITLHRGLGDKATRGLPENFTKSFVFPDLAPEIKMSSDGLFLTPDENPRIPLTTTNVQDVKVTVWRVYDRNLPLILSSLQDWNPDSAAQWARNLGSKTFGVAGPLNESTQRTINLKWFDEKPSGLYLVNVQSGDDSSDDYYEASGANQLVNVSDLGLGVRVYDRGVQLWASRISDTSPVADGRVTVYSAKNLIVGEGTTDKDGLLTILPDKPWTDDTRPAIAVLEVGDDVTFTPLTGDLLSDRGVNTDGAPWQPAPEGLWILPRNIWQPGETLQAEVLVRGNGALPVLSQPMRWSLTGPNGEMAGGTLTPNELGTATIETPLPEAMPTGSYSLALKIPGTDGTVAVRTIQIEEFRPPQIEVIFGEHPAVLQAGTVGNIEFSSRYLFGAPGSELSWTVSYRAKPFNWTSPELQGYRFGPWDLAKTAVQSGDLGDGQLDENGAGNWQWPASTPFESQVGAPMNVSLYLTVQEKGGRWIGKTLTLPWLPDRLLVGVIPPSGALVPGRTTDIPLALIDSSNKPASGKVDVTVSRVDSRWVMVTENGRRRMTWQEDLVKTSESSLTVKGKTNYSFKAPSEGTWQLDFECGNFRTSIRVDAWSGAQPQQLSGPENLTLSTDRQTYLTDQPVKLSVKSPFPGRLIITTGTDHPVSLSAQSMSGEEATFDLSAAELSPNGWCVASVARPQGSAKPYRALGAIAVRRNLESSKLAVTIDAPEKVEPGSLKATIDVKTADGQPASGTVSVVLIDRGILGLSLADNEDPWRWFTRLRRLDGSTADIYDQLMTKPDKATPALHPAGGAETRAMAALGESDLYSPVRAEDYEPTAIWLADLPVKDGQATLDTEIPEFQGSLRLEAIAVSPTGLGRATKLVTVARPLMTSVTFPRYLAAGDTFSTIVQVFATEDSSIELTATPDALLTFADGAKNYQTTITIKKGQATVDLPALKTANAAGTTSMTVTLKGANRTATQTVKAALRPAWPHVILSGGGKTDGTVALQDETKWFAGTGTTTVTLAGTPVADATKLLQATDGWGSAIERLIAMGWASIGLPRALGDPTLVNERELTRKRATVIAMLKALQNPDGSWSAWRNDDSGDAWTTASALQLLLAMKAKGLAVEESAIVQAARFLRQYMSRPLPNERQRESLDLEARAFGCFALSLTGEPPLGWMNWLGEQKTLSPNGTALLAAAWGTSGDRARANTLLGGTSPSLLVKDKKDGQLSSCLTNLTLRMIAHEAIAPGGADARADAEALAGALTTNDLSWIESQTGGLIVAALSSFADHAGSVATSGTLVDTSGDVLLKFTGSPVSWTGKAGTALSVKAKGGTLWYSWSANGIPASEPAPFAKGVQASLRLIDSQGKTVDGAKLAFGQEVSLRLAVKTATPQPDLRISLLLPAALEAQDNGSGDEKNVGSFRADRRFDRLVLRVIGAKGEFTWTVPCRVVFRGTFVMPPLSVEAPANPGIGYLGKSDMLIAK